jgi:hypothetical protein
VALALPLSVLSSPLTPPVATVMPPAVDVAVPPPLLVLPSPSLEAVATALPPGAPVAVAAALPLADPSSPVAAPVASAAP